MSGTEKAAGDTKRVRDRKRMGDQAVSDIPKQPPPEAMKIVYKAFDIPIYDDDDLRNLPNTWFRRRVRVCRNDDEKTRIEYRDGTWVPTGILVGQVRHQACVNGLEVSKDSRWMVSGSSDGRMKVWDISKLVQVRGSYGMTPEIDYKRMSGRVMGVTICEGTNRVAGVTDKGSVHVFTVGAETHGLLEKEARKLDTADRGSATTVTNCDTLSRSLLIYGTHLGSMHCWDFRRERHAFSLDIAYFTNNLGTRSVGIITASVVGPSGYTLFVGTSYGIIILWDLRYQLATSIWQHSSKSPIKCLAVASGDSIPDKTTTSTKAPVLLIAIKGIDEVSVFCVLTGVCKAVFKVIGSSLLLGNTGIWTKVQRRRRTSQKRSPQKGESSGFLKKSQRSSIVNPLSLPSLRVFDLRFAGISTKFESEFSLQTSDMKPCPRGINAFLLHERKGLFTAGNDRVIRFWHLRNQEFSGRISRDFIGPYSTKFSKRIENSTPIFEEQLLRHLDANPETSMNASKPRMPKGSLGSSTAHKYSILDLAAIELPTKLLVSADAGGVIKVWR